MQQLAAVPLEGQCSGAVRGGTARLMLPTLAASVAVAGAAVAYLLWPLLGAGLALAKGRKRGSSGYRGGGAGGFSF